MSANETYVWLAIGVYLLISTTGGLIFEDDLASREKGCRLPSTEFTLLSSDLDVEPGQTVPSNTVIRQSCEEGYGLDGYRNSTCVDGRWSTSEPQCKQMCRPAFKKYVRASCTFRGESVPCSAPAVHGTVVRCGRGDSSSDTKPNRMCADGEWTSSPLDCRGACGVERFGPTGDVRFAWHVAIYRKMSRTKRYSCGGTIVAPNVVLTAAHCVEYPTKPEWYSVGAGKESYNPDETASSQYRQVETIVVSPYYNGIDNLYGADLALLVLADPFAMNEHVAPVCLPPDDKRNEGPTDFLGTVPSWSVGASGEINERLEYTRMPAVEYRTCIDSVPKDFQKYITYDKICAGYTNGTGLCFGAGGGGLVSRDDRAAYTVRGIVSAVPRKDDGCDTSTYVAFTEVHKHLPWIYGTVGRYE